MATESSCTSYTEKWVNLFFTDDEVKCRFCPLLETYSRKQCRRTGEYITNDNVVGYWCPLLSVDDKGRIVNPENGEVLAT